MAGLPSAKATELKRLQLGVSILEEIKEAQDALIEANAAKNKAEQAAIAARTEQQAALTRYKSARATFIASIAREYELLDFDYDGQVLRQD